MAAIITDAGKAYLAAKLGAGLPAVFNEFVFALVTGLDPDDTPPGTEPLPAGGDIQYSCPVTRAGYVTPDQVVYSVLVDSSVGDWSFNWIGLKADDGTLVAVVYVPTQVKEKYDVLLGHRGNNLTRNFLLQYDNLQTITEITVNAATWQIDFTQRLDASDNMQESLAKALAGDGCLFLGNALKIENASGYKLRAGRAFVAGRTVDLAADVDAAAEGVAASKHVWLDVWRSGDVNGVVVNVDIVADISSATHDSYTDGNGIFHTVVKVASIDAGGAITDLRGTAGEVFTSAAAFNEFARIGHTHTPAQVGLSNIPNAKSDVAADNSNVLATVKAVWTAFNTAMASIAAHIANVANPHGTTAAQIGLGNLPNAKSDLLTVNDSNVLATSKAVFALKAICDAMPFSKFQQCPPQVYKGKSVGGTYVEVKSYTFKHTLGVVPKMVLMTLECIVGEGNYNVGDFLPISNSGPYSSTTAAFGHGMKKTAANIQISVDNNHGMMIHGWGLDENFELSNDCWKIHIMVCA